MNYRKPFGGPADPVNKLDPSQSLLRPKGRETRDSYLIFSTYVRSSKLLLTSSAFLAMFAFLSHRKAPAFPVNKVHVSTFILHNSL